MRSVRAGRPPHRRDSLVAELRRRILRGELPPGSRLPSRLTLTRQFNSAIPTVQDAVQCLVRDGFVETQGTRGTYVAEHPPHLCTYGLVLPRLRAETRFFGAIRAAARDVFNSESRRLRLFSPETARVDDPVAGELNDDVAHHRLAGVIVTWPNSELAGSPLFSADCDVPRVVIGGASRPDGHAVTPAVVLNIQTFFERAMDRLIARGRRKIAHLRLAAHDQKNPLILMLQQRGLEYRPYWHQRLGGSLYEAARGVAHLIMSLAPADRPDGLIVSDDNLVEHAQAGLADAGVRVPDEVDVIAHCNWPEPPASVLPVTRLGFDSIAVMRTCTRLIDEQRGGRATPQKISVDPVFEEELAAAAASFAATAVGPAVDLQQASSQAT
jgi:DNA-binding LacI/PurR family transcriptional regulator